MGRKIKSIAKLLLVVAVIGIIVWEAIYGVGAGRKGSASRIKLGLDLAGGVSITYETVKKNPTQKEIDDTIYKMQLRVDNYSTEAAVYQEGSNRINIDVPGVKDAEVILKELGRAGAIQFMDEKGNVVLEGSDIRDAEADMYRDDLGFEGYAVILKLNDAGVKKFARATAENVGKRIAIIYDDKVISAPIVEEPIESGDATITKIGSFDEAKNIAATIRIGALPLELREVRSNVVGAKLGIEALNTSLLAGVIGLALVAVFMIIYYRIPGFAAALALCIYTGLMVLLIDALDITLTLPGIAGILLSIGMAVDADCIIFTRIREELATGKTVRSAVKIGFHKALSAILDGNITTLIAAAVLYGLGSGTVKGFAQTLALGVILSMFIALSVTKFILYTLFDLGLTGEKLYGIQKEYKPFPFAKNRIKFIVISGIFILAGAAAMIYNSISKGSALNYGLDFKGGTSTEVTFPDDFGFERNVEIEKLVRNATGSPSVEISRVEGENTLIIRTMELSLDQRELMKEKLIDEYGVDPDFISTENISGAISAEMRQDAIVAVIIATVCMLLYIWIRFKNISFAAASVIPLVHDVLIVVAVYAAARISVGGTFIACLLTIIGYSINATIIVFDRIRELIRAAINPEGDENKDKDKERKKPARVLSDTELEDILNKSVTQTISRSINTSLTTFITVFVLFIMGTESIRTFAGPLMAGIVAGCYSSICIAGGLWYILYRKLSKKAETGKES